MSNPSIQSFYQKDRSSAAPPRASFSCRPDQVDDGLAKDETAVAVGLPTVPWNPQRDYQEVFICQLQNGPERPIKITGRIVNYSTAREIAARRPFLPEGYHFLVIRDDTGVVAIRLMASGSEMYPIEFGRLVTVWTTFAAEYATSSPVYVPSVSLIIPVHLGQYSSSCLKFHDEDQVQLRSCRRTLARHHGQSSTQDRSGPHPHREQSGSTGIIPSSFQQPPEPMNLSQYLSSDEDAVADANVLVCVRSIGPRKSVKPSKREDFVTVVDVMVFDETGACVLKLWGDKSVSANSWRPNQTVLLITNPVCRFRNTGKKDISVGFITLVDVDPVSPDAEWLRQMAAGTAKRESVYVPFLHTKWDMKQVDKTLFTIAEVDEFAREGGEFTGKLNLVVLEMSLMEHLWRGTLCCFECCGIPLYSNKAVAFCRNCSTYRDLTLNPRVIGTLADETGCITTGKLIWSDKALGQFFFQEPNSIGGARDWATADIFRDDATDIQDDNQAWETLTVMDRNSMRAVEEQLQYSRVTLTFGWSPTTGRISILAAEW